MDIITVCQTCNPDLLESVVKYCDLRIQIPNPTGFITTIGPCQALVDSVLIKYSDHSNGEKRIAKRFRKCLEILHAHGCDMTIERMILNLLEMTVPKKYWGKYLIEV